MAGTVRGATDWTGNTDDFIWFYGGRGTAGAKEVLRMHRKFGTGDMVICTASGVTGRVIKFYRPTACEEQTMVVADDGRKYHAPTSGWVKIEEAAQKRIKDTASGTAQKMLNPYGEYVVKFAENIQSQAAQSVKCNGG